VVTAILLTVHIFAAVILVGVVLLQRSEGGALGIGGGGMSGFLGGRATANLLTRTTAALAAVLFLTSLALARLGGPQAPASILDAVPPAASTPSQSPVQNEGQPAAPIAR
jgi:preprotein translocase subunit SecG